MAKKKTATWIMHKIRTLFLYLFQTRKGDEKDDKNSPQRFGVLHLLQGELLEGSVADFQSATDPSNNSP